MPNYPARELKAREKANELQDDANDLQQKMIDVIKKNNAATTTHNSRIRVLTIAIIILTALTITPQFFPLHNSEVINQNYMVRTNRFTGKVEFFYIGDNLLEAQEKYQEEFFRQLQQEGKEKKKQQEGKEDE